VAGSPGLRLAAVLGAALFLGPSGRAAEEEPPNVIFTGGNVYALDAAGTRAEAIAVRGGRILAVGSDREVLALAGAGTKRVDLKGLTVVPGLIDAHGHMAGLGALKCGREDLLEAASFDEVVKRVEARVRQARPGEWILGSRWDQANWGQKELPTNERLSAVSPDNPVMLWRVDGHAALANAKALALAGVGRNTPNPPGGEILRGPDGEPTGILVDAAESLVINQIRTPAADLRAQLLAAQEACLAAGLTGVHDAGLGDAEIALYRKLCDENRLKIRIYGMASGGAAAAEYMAGHRPLVGYGGGRFTLRAVKCYADGALGSRGAWLLADYSDRPGYSGLATQKPEALAAAAAAAVEHGWQLCTHAIGDRANRVVLDAYERASKTRPGADLRFRVEHAQVVDPADLPRFAKLGVIASMQPTHATSDMRWAADRLGDSRLAGAYAWATLVGSGAHLAGGSDFPVESERPLWGLYAAVTRQDRHGQPAGGWRPKERLTREQALRAFTAEAAYAAFEEKDKGTLEPGKLADFAAFSCDPLRCEPKELLTAETVMTVIGGEVVFRRKLE
jgi:predicted amidohydrolase YtcJ